ncbi:MAG: hypothetical protein U0232_29675 [Thermomicrobiales bacterium]
MLALLVGGAPRGLGVARGAGGRSAAGIRCVALAVWDRRHFQRLRRG